MLVDEGVEAKKTCQVVQGDLTVEGLYVFQQNPIQARRIYQTSTQERNDPQKDSDRKSNPL